MSARKRLLFLYPPWKPPGGSNAVAVVLIEALKREHDLTVLANDPLDREAMARAYGVHLAPGEVRELVVPPLWRRAVAGQKRWLLRYHALMRRGRQLAPDFDIALSANDETDFGRRGIQYVHYPRFDDPRVNPRAKRALETENLRAHHRSDLAMRAYFALCARVSGFDMDSMRKNLTLVNSAWTARIVKEVLDLDARVLHPPVPSDFQPAPWDARSADFVALGRVAGEKRTHALIAILAEVRAQTGWRGELHVVGPQDHPGYLAQIRAQAAAAGPWVRLRGELPRDELRRLLETSRFGIHGMAREHFGIAVAEMVNAGMVPFVPDDGGQVEIVGGQPALLWHDQPDAVAKIAALLGSAERLAEVRAGLDPLRGTYSNERFMAGVREIVAGF